MKLDMAHKEIQGSGSNLVLTKQDIRPSEEPRCLIIIAAEHQSKQKTVTLPVSTTSRELFVEVSRKFRYVDGSFELHLISKNKSHDDLQLTPNDDSLHDWGMKTDRAKNFLAIRGNPTEDTGEKIDEELVPVILPPPPPPPVTNRTITINPRQKQSDDSTSTFAESISEKASSINKQTTSRYSVGLVNQAMTCYLNSLIQTLFMTPEFRNAMYRWEYTGSIEDATTNIPCQLQRLFLALQTSTKVAVETTDLTKSFGWDSGEAWQQHDIQELCRVMFDALEKSFKDTEQANLIKQLYEGKMKDYVECCECGYESARKDAFLDIPITIRPFGASQSYSSVLEGLNAFVEPETLDGSNQYFCERCDKKCDAKKGLKFTEFPYLLTLQLKRFDFDYNTQHRIKLNERFFFPQKLKLGSFLEESSKQSLQIESSNNHLEDDRLSRDSGNDDDRLFNHKSTKASDESEGSSVDEGIDIESQKSYPAIGPSPTDDMDAQSDLPECDQDVLSSPTSSDGLHALDKSKEDDKEEEDEDPYTYELFSIMIHSGSAIGGHYYAYIKSFANGQWYSFNDQIVSPISMDDIERTYGGASSYSSGYASYSSSTSAYMLMYRLIDKSRNAVIGEFPEHIKQIIKREKEEEQTRRRRKERERNMCSVKVYCCHPCVLSKPFQEYYEVTYEFDRKLSLANVTEDLWKVFELDQNDIALDDCRLVTFSQYDESLGRSFDHDEKNQDTPLAKLAGIKSMSSSSATELLLEVRKPEEKFTIYNNNGITVKIFTADYSIGNFGKPEVVYMQEDTTVGEIRQLVAQWLQVDCKCVRMLYEYSKYALDVRMLNDDMKTIRDQSFYKSAKIFIDTLAHEDGHPEPTTSRYGSSHIVKETKLFKLIERNNNLLRISIALPQDVEYDPHDHIFCEEISGHKLQKFESLGDLTQKKTAPTTPPASPTESPPNYNDLSPPLSPPKMDVHFELAVDPNQCIANTKDDKDIRHVSFANNPKSNTENFDQILSAKLQGISSTNSSSSSLNCEDGYSSNEQPTGTSPRSEPQTYIATAFNEEDVGAGAIMTDSGGSCSTLDSTETLCNDQQRCETNSLLDKPYANLASGISKPLPGHALRLTDDFASGDANRQSTNKYALSPTINQQNSTVSNDNCNCVTNTPMNDLSYKCLTCGKIKATTMKSFDQMNYQSESTIPERRYSQDDIDSIDIQPLFSEFSSSYGEHKDPPDYNTAIADQERRNRTESTSSAISDLGYGSAIHTQHSGYLRIAEARNEDVEAKDETTKMRVLYAQIDKRSTVGWLKNRLRSIVKARSRDFSLYRVPYPKQEHEMNDLSENFTLMPEDMHIRVKLERALRKDEHRCKVFLLQPNKDEFCKSLLDWVVRRGLMIKDALDELSIELQEQCEIDISPKRLRLRRKMWESPGKIFLGKDSFGTDILLYSSVEIFLEMLPDDEVKINSSQLSFYYRVWQPSTLTLGMLHEIVVDTEKDTSKYSEDEMKRLISESSGIQLENLEFVRPTGQFPYHMNALDVHSISGWSSETFPHISDDGGVIYIRDSNEELKVLSDSEKIELRKSEGIRLKALNCDPSTTSRRGGVSSKSYGRKEKALKIYTT